MRICQNAVDFVYRAPAVPNGGSNIKHVISSGVLCREKSYLMPNKDFSLTLEMTLSVPRRRPRQQE